MRERSIVVHRLESVDSTNEEAKRLARMGAAHGEAVVADVQTAGKGRRGRRWLSPPGQNLYLSVVLRPEIPPARAPLLVAVSAVAVAEALRSFGAEAKIKWPNDVEVGGRKICGILLELSLRDERVDFAVAGFGVNLEGDLSTLGAEIAERATTLERELGIRPGRDEVMRRILSTLEERLGQFEREGFAPIRARYLELSSTVGARVRLFEPERTIEGVALDVDDEGALWVEVDGGGIERHLTGDLVTLRRVE